MERRVVESERIYEGRVLNLRVDRVEVAPEKFAPREVVEHTPGVCVLPVDGEGNVYLVRQYRHPMGEDVLEAPAGMMELGEEPAFTARREMKEEIGAEGELTYLGEYLSSPGYCSELVYLFLSRVDSFGDTNPDEDEYLQTVKMPFSRFYQMATEGSIRDGKTLVLALRAAPLLKF